MPQRAARSSPLVAIDAPQRALAARDALVERYIALVAPIAHRLAAQLPSCFELEDLIAAGNVGLIRAAARYRPEKHDGTPFSAYARFRIKGAMLDSVRRKQWDEAVRPARGEGEDAALLPTFDADIDALRLLKRVRAAVAELPERQRRVIRGFYAEGDSSPAVVGAALGLDEFEAERERAAAIAELRRRLAASEGAA